MIITTPGNVTKRFIVDVNTDFASILLIISQSLALPDLFWLTIHNHASAVKPDMTPADANMIHDISFHMHVDDRAPEHSSDNSFAFDFESLQENAVANL